MAAAEKQDPGVSPDEEEQDTVCSLDDVFLLVREQIFPESWKGGKISYGFLKLILDVAEEVVQQQGRRQDDLAKQSLKILDKNIVSPTKFSNLKPTVLKRLNNPKANAEEVVSSLYRSADSESSVSGFIGQKCENKGIDISIINNVMSGEAVMLPPVIFTNGMIKELEDFRKRNNFTYVNLRNWINALSLSKCEMNERSVRSNVERMLLKRAEMIKKGEKGSEEELMEDEFRLPRQKNDEEMCRRG